MSERFAFAIVPGTGWRAREIEDVAKEAEAAGFEAILSVEANNDGMATAQLMGAATKNIKVGTWIASIYLRHSYLCAQGAALIADATDGRMMLGLGVSHQPVNATLGVDMGSPLSALRRYVVEVQEWLSGDGPATHLAQHPAPVPVPVYIAALNSKSVELAGELADGVMPFLWPAPRIEQSKTWIARGRAKAPERRKLEITLGLPTFVGNDIEEMRTVARKNLALYATLPFYQRLFHLCGFEDEARKAEQGQAEEALSARLLDAVCLIGSLDRCREQLARFRAAGVDLPILYPPIGVESATETIRAFRQ
jgi:alkanesulfonate monooxygenase SsuD/methylene tetrahydromethanopterin reductase-like flavin-dependent oxidoreductase (luciferase family)